MKPEAYLRQAPQARCGPKCSHPKVYSTRCKLKLLKNIHPWVSFQQWSPKPTCVKRRRRAVARSVVIPKYIQPGVFAPKTCFFDKSAHFKPRARIFLIKMRIYSGVPMLSMNSRSWKKKHHLSHAPYINHKSRDNKRQDCCGISPTFLSFGTHQGKNTPYVTAI